jgi:hypothetical protein
MVHTTPTRLLLTSEAFNTLVFEAKTAVEGATITGERNAAHIPPVAPVPPVPGPGPRLPVLKGVNPASPSNPRFSMFNKKLALAITSLSDAAPPRNERTTGGKGGGVVVVVYAAGGEKLEGAAVWAWP